MLSRFELLFRRLQPFLPGLQLMLQRVLPNALGSMPFVCCRTLFGYRLAVRCELLLASSEVLFSYVDGAANWYRLT